MVSNHEVAILPKIIEGMKASLSDAKSFTEDFSAIANAEYLITVNIAKKIASLGPIGGPLQIATRLECKTKRFATSCVPLMKKLQIKGTRGGKTIFRKAKNVYRNGRIDIAVFEKTSGFSDPPICAIEIKGFDQPKKTVIEDLRRNAEYFKLRCDTGKSQVKFTAFCAFRRFKNTQMRANATQDLNEVRKRYLGYMKSVCLPADVEYELKPFTASEWLMDGTESQEEYGAISHEIHHHAGIIVVFRWKGNSPAADVRPK